MPRDALYEESAQAVNGDKQRKWYTVFLVFSVVFAVLAFIHTFVCIMMLPTMLKGQSGMTIAILLLLWLSPLVVLALTSFFLFRLRLRFNVSFDYTFVTDELRITKVFNGKKRKHIVTLEADHVLQIGYCEGATFDRTYAGLGGAKPKVLTPNRDPAEGKDFIHILYSTSGGKSMYIIECRKEMLEYLVLAAGRNKFVRE